MIIVVVMIRAVYDLSRISVWVEVKDTDRCEQRSCTRSCPHRLYSGIKQIMQVSRASFDVVVLLEEYPFAHFCPYFRIILENLGRSPSREKLMRIVSYDGGP